MKHKSPLRERARIQKIMPFCIPLFQLFWHSNMNMATQFGYFISHDSRMFFKDITRSHGYSLITYSDLNQQQIDLCYNCTVNLTGNTVNRTPLLPVAVHLFPNMPPWLSSLLFNPFTPA